MTNQIGKVGVKEPYPVLLNERSYPLNKSKTKFVSVGLRCSKPFVPTLTIFGLKNDWILFEEAEWKVLIENEGVISNYFYSKGIHLNPLDISSVKRICFQKVNENKVIIIQDKCGAEVYLGIESVIECFELLQLLEYKIAVLKSLNFDTFYSSLIAGAWNLPGEFKTNIENVLNGLNIKSDNVVCMKEMLKYGLEIIRSEIEINQYVQSMASP